MEAENRLIQIRRGEVERELAQLDSRVGELRAELLELETTERVLLRLSGAKRGAPSAANQSQPATAHREEADGPSMAQMILAVFADAQAEGHRTLEPRDIANRVTAKFGVEAKGDFVGSIVWRMWKRAQIRKIRKGVYALPKENEAAAVILTGNAAASETNPAQGREAGPGGGT